MIRGIDVSDKNGKLNWDIINNEGIKFAIIRAGYGGNYEKQDDKQNVYNMDECERLNIPYGVYIYSYCLNTSEAESEAEHALRLIKGRKPVLGVFIDMEDSDGYKAKNGLVPEENGAYLTEFCNIFVRKLSQAGYRAGVYANKYYFDNILKIDELEGVKWLAIWGRKECPVDWAEIWQYTSDGTIENSGSARFDMNYYINEDNFNSLTMSGNKYSIGDIVYYDKIYTSSNSEGDGLRPLYKYGKIIKIYENARHPYLLENNIGFIDDGCITEIRGNEDTLRTGVRIRIKKGAIDLNTKRKYAGYVYENTYVVIQLKGDRVVFGLENGNVTGATDRKNIEVL